MKPSGSTPWSKSFAGFDPCRSPSELLELDPSRSSSELLGLGPSRSLSDLLGLSLSCGLFGIAGLCLVEVRLDRHIELLGLCCG